MSLSKGAKKKGYIIRQSDKEKMTFQFNPTTHDYGRAVNYSIAGAPGSSYPSSFQYVRGNEQTYSIDLFMYCKGEKKNTIEPQIKFILSLVPKDSNTKKFEKPPEIIVCVGNFIKRCVVTNYKVHVEEYDEKGKPVNVTVTLGLLQVGVK